MSTRRDFLKTSTVAAGGLAFGAAFTAPQCGGVKNLSSYVQMVAGGFSEIKVLLPDLGLSQSIIAQVAELIDRGVKIAKDFDTAYKAGKFSDASTLFTGLGETVSQVVSTLGVSTDNRAVKVALAAIGIARVAIAILLQRQADDQPQIASAVQAGKQRSAEAKAISEVERLAETDLTKVLALLPK
jgi:hypothetical protein